MKREPAAAAQSDADAAIAGVLAAQRAAREAIATVERAGAESIEEARAVARRIAERAERRIGLARERYEAHIARDVEAMRAEAESLETRHSITAVEARAVGEAVAALARELTGSGR